MKARDPLPGSPAALFEWLVNLLHERYRSGSQSPAHITVVLGAGSSLWSGLPRWDTHFRDELVARGSEVFQDFVQECWRQLSPTIGLPPRLDPAQLRSELIRRASIEDIASVALRYGSVGDRIHDLFRKRFTAEGAEPDDVQPPQLAYELVAHFLKHGFVDHLITFNFDELLDEAVENELGRGEFVHVASDHDISTRSLHDPRDEPPHAALLPHLIKLHGTISRPQTLRFTRHATSALSLLTIQLLDRVVFGLTPEPAEPAPAKRRNYIVSLGYGWGDADALHWLDARREVVSGLFMLAKRDDCERLRSTFAARGWPKGTFQTLDIDAFCDAPVEQRTVDLFLWALWEELEQRMRTEGVPFMPASRHILLSYLFSPESLDGGRRLNAHNALRRFVVEFVLHVAKCKGMVNLSTISSSERIRRYYYIVKRKYSQAARDANADLLTLVNSVGFIRWKKETAETARGRTVQQSIYPDVKETYYSLAKSPAELVRPLTNANSFNLGSAYNPKFDRSLGRIAYGSTGGSGEQFIEGHLRAIFEGPEIEVGRRTSERGTWTLRSASPLLTYIDLQNETRAILGTRWTDLLVIAESGAWLAKESMGKLLVSGTSRRVFLIEARHPSRDDPGPTPSGTPAATDEWPLRREISVNLHERWTQYRHLGVDVFAAPLAWWQHNRHMTLAFERAGDTATCLGGIFFRRRHQKSRIQPLLVDPRDAEDVSELVVTYLAYLRRAVEEHRRALKSLPGARPSTLPQLVQGALDIASRVEHPPSVAPRMQSVIDELGDATAGL